MNEIAKNAQTFLETLQSASGEEVEEWDTEALRRAIQWAKYFEEVHKKLANKPKSIQQLNRVLNLIGHLPGAGVSQSEVTFESLGQSVRLLLQALLQNTHLSSDLYREVINQYTQLDRGKSPDGNSASSSQCDEKEEGIQTNQILIQDVSRFAKAKAMRMHLLEMRLKLTQSLQEDLNIEGKSVHQVALETDASLLRDHLMHHLTGSRSLEKTKDYLDKRLHYVAKLPNGIETIDSILVLPGSENETEAMAFQQCEQFVSEWITKNRQQYIQENMDTG
ncbi:uncharacterized protein LOC119727765 [Patiria miniata]|uniref:Uncharacterized protein n=1 Tax=Patiria miniata TaxID=46514 RepID=A0A913ZW38_PATMI|nr:uncharacterized protein LOC119727765 [Patiria miniata]XP_038055743.1 uncharacterized protein LOC119727765 [Patiria miniata]